MKTILFTLVAFTAVITSARHPATLHLNNNFKGPVFSAAATPDDCSAGLELEVKTVNGVNAPSLEQQSILVAMDRAYNGALCVQTMIYIPTSLKVLDFKTTSCGSLVYETKSNGVTYTLVDHRTRLCRDIQPGLIQFVKTDKHGQKTTLYSQGN